MRTVQRTWVLLALALSAPGVAYAHGQEVLVYPLVIVFALQLVPVADFLRRRAWSIAAFYVFTQPLLWGVAVALGFALSYIASFFTEEFAVVVGLVSGLIALLVMPFLYWRYLLRKGVTNAAA